MKKNYLLSAAAAFLLAVTGCSDDIENGGNSGGEDDGNHAYMNVRISTVADGPMTKADPSWRWFRLGRGRQRLVG